MEYQSEIKKCQNCKNDFLIESEDFKFYEKIQVPSPTFCPECRMIRRMIWRNCRSLFKRNCGNCGKSIISMYSDDKIKNPYCMDCWNSDNRDPFLYGKDYDFSRTFFSQLSELFHQSPILYIHHTGTLVRSDFTNYSADNKDCYLSFSVIDGENILYSEVIDKSRNSIDCYAVQRVENCSYNIDCENNYNCHFAVKSQKCIDSLFIYDCINCQNCCLSSNLRNKQYVFKNKKLTKEEYETEVSKLEINKYSGLKNSQKLFDELYTQNSIHRFAQIYSSSNAEGDYIGNSKDIYNSFDVQNSENVHNSVRVIYNSKDCYDNQGTALGELIYESVATSFSTFRDFFTYICVGSKECEYSFMCKNCSNCFACTGLKNSKYCILNKQYSKEEYFILVAKIKKHMNEMPYIDDHKRVYKYGEFFPYDMSPFGYNETNANDFFPISKEEALYCGYPWKDREERDYNITINSEDLPDDIYKVTDSILNEIISCPSGGKQEYQCTYAYRIVKEELQFYKQKGLPLPRYCSNCRHYQRLKYRNYPKLYIKKCMNNGCDNEFKTTYNTENSLIVYCEKCYQKEII